MSWFEELRREALLAARAFSNNDGGKGGAGDHDNKWARDGLLSSSSPVNDVHVFATDRQVFMLNEKRKLQPLLDVDKIGSDRVTAVACLPVLETLASSGSQLLWHCAVVGFASGHVEVVGGDGAGGAGGQTLVRRRFADSPVRRIRANTIHLRRNQYSACLDPVFLPLLSDILVVYANMVALVLNEHLYVAMVENRVAIQ